MHLATSVPTNFDEGSHTRFGTTEHTTDSHAACEENHWQYPPTVAVLDKASNMLTLFVKFHSHRVASAKPQKEVLAARTKVRLTIDGTFHLKKNRDLTVAHWQIPRGVRGGAQPHPRPLSGFGGLSREDSGGGGEPVNSPVL